MVTDRANELLDVTGSAQGDLVLREAMHPFKMCPPVKRSVYLYNREEVRTYHVRPLRTSRLPT